MERVGSVESWEWGAIEQLGGDGPSAIYFSSNIIIQQSDSLCFAAPQLGDNTAMAPNKRGPYVLATDSRDRAAAAANNRPVLQRQGTAVPGRLPMQYISVDNVLRYASQIPSGQPRLPPDQSQPGQRPSVASRTAGRRTTARAGLPTLASARTGQQNVPSRTTKVSEKLVLIPDTPDDDDADEANGLDGENERMKQDIARGEEEEGRPLRDEELEILRKRGGIRGKSYAERLPKVQRAEKVSRLTAYCTAQAYKMKATAEFLRTKHEAKTKLYDDCLYVVYHLPLMSGIDGCRLRSRPILKSPGTGKTVLDLEIERSERRDEHYAYFDEDGGSPGSGSPSSPSQMPYSDLDGQDGSAERARNMMTDTSFNPINRLAPDAKNFAEMFVYSYGVVVFWNFTERQEKDILADLTFSANPLVTRPFDQTDYETEEFHFEYNVDIKHPRIFNDMITLLPRSDHMVKLSISHAVAQSTKLCFFEEKLSETMQEAQHIPKRLAQTGELNMTRIEIVKILGRLFKSRVDINLCE